MDTSWIKEHGNHLMIAGPCSAESEDQILQISKELKEQGVDFVRAGIWKPRTRPNSFEGIGAPALQWLQTARQELGVKFAIEVANPAHVEAALEAGIDLLWIGARSTVNPFTVQEIAESLKGVDIPVLVKNPVNPDLALWIGALERLLNQDVKKLGAIHRGFSSFGKKKYRNEPLWQIPLELKRQFPTLPLICDPSHIAGLRSMIGSVSQKALDLNYDGLIIEVHPNPDKALSDAQQQITPETFSEMKKSLHVRHQSSDDELFKSKLEQLRNKINIIDHDIIDALSARRKVVEEIGLFKKENDVMVFQLERWNEIMRTRPDWGKAVGLDAELVERIYKQIHEDSLKAQIQILNKELNGQTP